MSILLKTNDGVVTEFPEKFIPYSGLLRELMKVGKPNVPKKLECGKCQQELDEKNKLAICDGSTHSHTHSHSHNTGGGSKEDEDDEYTYFAGFAA